MKIFGYSLRIIAILWGITGLINFAIGVGGISLLSRSQTSLVLGGLGNLLLAYGAWKWGTSILIKKQKESSDESTV